MIHIDSGILHGRGFWLRGFLIEDGQGQPVVNADDNLVDFATQREAVDQARSLVEQRAYMTVEVLETVAFVRRVEI